MTPASLLLLGWSGLKALVKRPFKAPHAMERVLRRGAAERIASLDAAGLAGVRRSSACLACGRCDEVGVAGGGTASPADWVLAGLRDLTDRDLGAEAPGDAARLERMEAVCPVRVPFRDLARDAAAMCGALSSP
ncbi:MAG: hypothetical protein HY907_13205 [Deltaproteobacteria bacterium]|nr:hypothetical protein [Deltaproteobacteria bacterium]